MRITKLAAGALLGLSALALQACAAGLPTQVSRHQAMPAPQGQSFFVVPADGRRGGLEFQRYATLVAQAMQAQGYAAAPSPQAATMLVSLDYGIDDGTTEYVADTMGPGSYWGSSPYWGRPYYSRWGYYGPRSPYYYGWDNPFMTPVGGFGPYGPFYQAVRPVTVYKSFVDMDIRRRTDSAPLFEGRAAARSDSDNLGTLVPNLVTAMFTGFPGRSGETVKITVPPAKR